MATKKVIFFTAGSLATAGELAAIAKLQARALPDYAVFVRNGDSAHASPNYGFGPETTDYVAGTVPAAYSASTVIDPNSIPSQNLLPTQAVVANAQVVTVGGVAYTFTVAGGAITAIAHTP